MATKKPAKDVKGAAKKKDGDDEVLFEGELTWTHEHIPASPELMKRTPRGQEPVQAAHAPLPSEGLIEIKDSTEGGGEIFSNEPLRIDHEEATAEPVDQSTYEQAPKDGKLTDVTPAPVKGSRLRDRVLMPRDGFSKETSDPFASDIAQAGSVGNNPLEGTPAMNRPEGTRPVASQFAAPEPEAPARSRSTKLGIIISAVTLVVAGAVAAYVVVVVPKKPDNVFKAALANTMQQQSVTFALDARQSDTAGTQQMHFVAAGGVGRVGSLNMAATLTNPLTPAPLVMSVSSIDGSDSYVQFTNLAANQAYLTKLGIPNGPVAAAQEGKWLRVTADVRAMIFQGLGLSSSATWSLGSSDQQTLADMYKRNQFLNVSKTVGEETVGGQASTHYVLAINKTQLTAFMIAAKNGAKSLGITQSQIDAANKLDTSKFKLEAWAGEQNKLLTQVQITKQNAAGTYTATLSLPKYNEQLPLQQPTASDDLTTALKSFISPTATDADAQALLAKILSNYSLVQP